MPGTASREVKKIEVTMPCKLGLHARTATRFIVFVRQFSSRIRIIKGELMADGKSILGLLALGASWKSRLLIEIEGEDAERACQAIEGYFLTAAHCDDRMSS